MTHGLIEDLDWRMHIHVNKHAYDFNWVRITRVADGYTTHKVRVYADGHLLDNADKQASRIIETVSAYRVSELSDKYKWDYTQPGSVHTFLQDSIAELAERAAEGEYLGQSVNEFLYINLVARILNWSEIGDDVLEMVEDGRLSLNGNIIAPKGHTY
jgi:hypothetical protein